MSSATDHPQARIALRRREGRVLWSIQPPSPFDPSSLIGLDSAEAVAQIAARTDSGHEAHAAAARALLGLRQPADLRSRLSAERVREAALPLLRDWPAALGLPPGRCGEAETLTPASVRHRIVRTAATRMFRARAEVLGCGELAQLAIDRLFDACQEAEHAASAALIGGDGWAAAAVATGFVRHRGRLEGGRVAAYSIETPTDRLFATGGRVEQVLAELPGDAPQLDAARVVVAALCPSCAVNVVEEAPVAA